MAPQVRAAAVAAWPVPCCASCPPCIRPAYARGPTRGARRAVLRPGVLGQAVRRGHGLLRVVPRLRRAARGAGRAPVAQHPHPAGVALFVCSGVARRPRALQKRGSAARAGSGSACCTPAGSVLLAVVAGRAGRPSAQLGAHAGARRWGWARPRCSWTWCWTATTASPTWTTRRWP